MIDNNERVMASASEDKGPRSARHDHVPASARVSREAEFPDRTYRHPGMRRDPALVAHRAAVANTLTWAEESAARGDYANALAWLSVLDAIGETLPDEYETKRIDWREARAEQHTPQCTA